MSRTSSASVDWNARRVALQYTTLPLTLNAALTSSTDPPAWRKCTRSCVLLFALDITSIPSIFGAGTVSAKAAMKMLKKPLSKVSCTTRALGRPQVASQRLPKAAKLGVSEQMSAAHAASSVLPQRAWLWSGHVVVRQNDPVQDTTSSGSVEARS